MHNITSEARHPDSLDPGTPMGDQVLPGPTRRRSRQLKSTPTNTSAPYLAPKELAARWQISRSSLERLAEEQGFTKLYLGDARNSAVRFRLDEVLRYEREHEVHF